MSGLRVEHPFLLGMAVLQVGREALRTTHLTQETPRPHTADQGIPEQTVKVSAVALEVFTKATISLATTQMPVITLPGMETVGAVVQVGGILVMGQPLAVLDQMDEFRLSSMTQQVLSFAQRWQRLRQNFVTKG